MRSQILGRVSGVMVIINKTQKSGMSFVADHIFLRSTKQSNTHVLSCFNDAPKIRPANVSTNIGESLQSRGYLASQGDFLGTVVPIADVPPHPVFPWTTWVGRMITLHLNPQLTC